MGGKPGPGLSTSASWAWGRRAKPGSSPPPPETGDWGWGGRAGTQPGAPTHPGSSDLRLPEGLLHLLQEFQLLLSLLQAAFQDLAPDDPWERGGQNKHEGPAGPRPRREAPRAGGLSQRLRKRSAAGSWNEVEAGGGAGRPPGPGSGLDRASLQGNRPSQSGDDSFKERHRSKHSFFSTMYTRTVHTSVRAKPTPFSLMTTLWLGHVIALSPQ